MVELYLGLIVYQTHLGFQIDPDHQGCHSLIVTSRQSEIIQENTSVNS